MRGIIFIFAYCLLSSLGAYAFIEIKDFENPLPKQPLNYYNESIPIKLEDNSIPFVQNGVEEAIDSTNPISLNENVAFSCEDGFDQNPDCIQLLRPCSTLEVLILKIRKK